MKKRLSRFKANSKKQLIVGVCVLFICFFMIVAGFSLVKKAKDNSGANKPKDEYSQRLAEIEARRKSSPPAQNVETKPYEPKGADPVKFEEAYQKAVVASKQGDKELTQRYVQEASKIAIDLKPEQVKQIKSYEVKIIEMENL